VYYIEIQEYYTIFQPKVKFLVVLLFDIIIAGGALFLYSPLDCPQTPFFSPKWGKIRPFQKNPKKSENFCNKFGELVHIVTGTSAFAANFCCDF
jgi:hypothetical protein